MDTRLLQPLVALSALVASLVAVGPALANERHFTYTYETAVLPPEALELEVWTTFRTGREDYYSRFDHRLEFEVGLTERLQTALYVNFSAVTAEDEFGTRLSTFAYQGVSSEWKYKLTDPVADPVGFALYAEGTASTDEYELEGKLIFDKLAGDVLLAANLIVEHEWELGDDETEREWILSPVAAASFVFSPSFSLGIELRNHNEIVEGEWEHAALFGGPVAAYARETWWAALTILPQLVDLRHGGVEVEEHERVEARLLFAMHL